MFEFNFVIIGGTRTAFAETPRAELVLICRLITDKDAFSYLLLCSGIFTDIESHSLGLDKCLMSNLLDLVVVLVSTSSKVHFMEVYTVI